MKEFITKALKSKHAVKIIEALAIIIIVSTISIVIWNSNKDNSRNTSNTGETTQLLQTTTMETETTTIEETTQVTTQIQTETSATVVTPKATEATTVAEPVESKDFVSYLNVSGSVSQMIVVSANGTRATVTMHNKSSDGTWNQILSTSGYIGKSGVGQVSESTETTPSGVYTLSFAFGIYDNPGTNLSYTKVDDSYYWVDDMNSAYYNKFVSTNSTVPDWSSAEHIIECKKAYQYVIPIDYNTDCVKGAGSAIFLHVSFGAPTEGCVTVPESDMVFILNNIWPGCIIVIDNQQNINNY